MKGQMGTTAPPTVARLNHEISINPIRNVLWKIGGSKSKAAPGEGGRQNLQGAANESENILVCISTVEIGQTRIRQSKKLLNRHVADLG